jgi:hypothetical protein
MSAAAIGRREFREQSALVVRGMELFARYDSLRLRTYQACENLDGKIHVAAMGPATALRFDDVGYFNRVYAPAAVESGDVRDFEVFYRGCPFPCELVGLPLGVSGTLDAVCRSRGWVEGKHYAWVGGPIPPLLPGTDNSCEFTIRSPGSEERAAFLSCYLRGFEAEPVRFQAAMRNMRHLFTRPELSFLMALRKGRPAGVGMLYREGRLAILCAGATLPEERRSGCHAALLDARFRLAAGLGCDEIYSWALMDGQSHTNMERAGLLTLGVTRSWSFPAGSPLD